MRALHLDYQAQRRPSAIGLLALAIAIVAVAAALWQFERLAQQHAKWDAEVALAQSRLAQGTSERRDRSAGARSAEEVAAAQDVVCKLRFPWQEMFSAFEAATNEEIALLGIEPDAGKRTVKLTVESKSSKGMFNYVRRLQRTAFLEQVMLQQHEVQTDDPQKPLRFIVVATWKHRE